MNERIRQLWEQAAKTTQGDSWEEQTKFMVDRKFDVEHFAELIVRECLSQVDKIRDGLEADGEDQQALGADWAGLAIARHFGVEQ